MNRVYTILYIRDGEITNKQAVRKLFEKLQDGRYKLEISDANKRTLQQNAWFHAVLPDILQGLRDVGYNTLRNTDDAKDVVKAIFFKKKVTNGIEEIEIIQGTSDTEKIDFVEKADQIITWAKEYLGIDVAPPASQTSIDYGISNEK
jgi:hypothetical protein